MMSIVVSQRIFSCSCVVSSLLSTVHILMVDMWFKVVFFFELIHLLNYTFQRNLPFFKWDFEPLTQHFDPIRILSKKKLKANHVAHHYEYGS